jgi:predicted outer membrane lipoprotein
VSLALLLGALLAAACVIVVALPYLHAGDERLDAIDAPGELEQRRLALAEARDRALAALKELELDHRTGKVTDEDYRTLVGPLRREAAEALRGLEPRAGCARVTADRSG